MREAICWIFNLEVRASSEENTNDHPTRPTTAKLSPLKGIHHRNSSLFLPKNPKLVTRSLMTRLYAIPYKTYSGCHEGASQFLPKLNSIQKLTQRNYLSLSFSLSLDSYINQQKSFHHIQKISDRIHSFLKSDQSQIQSS